MGKLTDDQKIDLMNHIRDCQSAYYMEMTNHRLCIPGNLQNSHGHMIRFVESLLDGDYDDAQTKAKEAINDFSDMFGGDD